jgi:hypothetical protein
VLLQSHECYVSSPPHLPHDCRADPALMAVTEKLPTAQAATNDDKMPLAQKFAYFLFVHGTVLNKTWSTNQSVPYLWHILGA